LNPSSIVGPGVALGCAGLFVFMDVCEIDHPICRYPYPDVFQDTFGTEGSIPPVVRRAMRGTG